MSRHGVGAFLKTRSTRYHPRCPPTPPLALVPEFSVSHFSKEALDFFRGLARNNKKPWFEAHRVAYEQQVKLPMMDLVSEMDLRLERFAPEIEGDPKRSVFRINRDIRFAKDKSEFDEFMAERRTRPPAPPTDVQPAG